MKLNFEEAVTKNTRTLLVLSFCALVLAKALLSLKFQSPWLLPDEVSYAKMAGDIFGSVHPNLPRGYPFLLSIAYVPSENMRVVYHLMLLINCFLSSLILFPSYFILNKYCPRDFSFMGAVTVAALPSLTLYTFLLTTENLFVPLFVFSIWFLLEAYETEKPLWIFLTLLSVSLLFFTRHTGIFMVMSIVASLGYYLLFGRRSKSFRGKIVNNLANIIFLLFVALALATIVLVLTGSNKIYFNWIINRINTDGPIFLDLFRDVNHLADYLILLQNEIGYLIIASYFIFFFLSLIFFFYIFSYYSQKSFSSSLSRWYKSLDIEKRCSLKSTGIYYLLTSVVLILTTTMSVYRQNWEIIGRYVDPIIPGLFLFGFIGLYHMHEASGKQDLRVVAILAVIFSLIFFYRFPTLTPNIITIYYINFLKSLAPNWIIFPALAAGSFLLLHSYRNLGDRRRIFFAALIMFSVCTTTYTYHADLVFHSKANYDQNQIGDYLNRHSAEDILIIMDENDTKKDWYFAAMTKFWIKSKVVYQPIKENLSDLKSNKKETYLITSKVLPLEPSAISARGYYLYKL